MNVEPYDDDVACAGPTTPSCEQIADLIRLLVTIQHRFGNTAVQYRISWGGSALWAEDALRKQIGKLEKKVERLKKELAKAVEPPLSQN